MELAQACLPTGPRPAMPAPGDTPGRQPHDGAGPTGARRLAGAAGGAGAGAAAAASSPTLAGPAGGGACHGAVPAVHGGRRQGCGGDARPGELLLQFPSVPPSFRPVVCKRAVTPTGTGPRGRGLRGRAAFLKMEAGAPQQPRVKGLVAVAAPEAAAGPGNLVLGELPGPPPAASSGSVPPLGGGRLRGDWGGSPVKGGFVAQLRPR